MTKKAKTLTGVCVLILEDDYYLAMDLHDTLHMAGAAVLGPFASADAAIDALASDRPTCALLDLNLRQGMSLDLPRELERRSIPFAFVTGYDRAAIPAEFNRYARAEKPIAVGKAVELVERMTSSTTSAA